MIKSSASTVTVSTTVSTTVSVTVSVTVITSGSSSEHDTATAAKSDKEINLNCFILIFI